MLRLLPDSSCADAVPDTSEAADAPRPVPSLVLAIGDELATTGVIGLLVCGLTFELTGEPQPAARKLQFSPAVARPAVGSPVERRVRPHC